MGIYDTKKASLDTPEEAESAPIEGEGFAFTEKTVFGKTFQGVFFVEEDEEMENLDELQAQEDELSFTGIVYDRRRSYRESFPIMITDVTSTRAGNRVDFVSADNPPETLPE